MAEIENDAAHDLAGHGAYEAVDENGNEKDDFERVQPHADAVGGASDVPSAGDENFRCENAGLKKDDDETNERTRGEGQGEDTGVADLHHNLQHVVEHWQNTNGREDVH